MPLSERVRIEVFIPDLPDPAYTKLLTQLQIEFSYAFGGCTVISASGSFLSQSGIILPDNIKIIFTDVSLAIATDRMLIGQYVELVSAAVTDSLRDEESILVSLYAVYHDEQ